MKGLYQKSFGDDLTKWTLSIESGYKKIEYLESSDDMLCFLSQDDQLVVNGWVKSEERHFPFYYFLVILILI